MKTFLVLAALVAFATAPAAAFASISYSGGAYSQDFNSLSGTPSLLTWTNDVTIQGWYASFASTGNNPVDVVQYRVENLDNNLIQSWGPSGSTTQEQALSSSIDGAGGPGTRVMWYGAEFVNSTASTLTEFTLQYTGEQWYKSGNGSGSGASFVGIPETLSFAYSVGATSLTTGTYTSFAALDFTSPNNTAGAAFIDGNAAANRTVIGPTTVTGLSWAPGASLWIRWQDNDEAGAGVNHALGIDDLSFSAQVSTPPPGSNDVVPEPASLFVFGGLSSIAGVVAFLSNRRRKG